MVYFLQLKFRGTMEELRFLWQANGHVVTLSRIHRPHQLLVWLKSMLVLTVRCVLFVYRFKPMLFSLRCIFSVCISKSICTGPKVPEAMNPPRNLLLGTNYAGMFSDFWNMFCMLLIFGGT